MGPKGLRCKSSALRHMKKSEERGEIWFTSDTHYGHANVIKYCDRPFADVHEMNEALIENFNECVRPGDTVFHLGDFSFLRDPGVIRRRLNGNLHLIAGNHDWKQMQELRRLPWGWIRDTYMLRAGGTKIWLSHFAHRAWPNAHHGAIHLYGHSHGALEDHGRSTDVGVDPWDYCPVNLDEILDMMKDRPVLKHHEE